MAKLRIKLWKVPKTQNVTVLIVTVVTVAIVTVVKLTYFSKKQLDTMTTDEIFSGQLLTIFAMFWSLLSQLSVLSLLSLLSLLSILSH